MKPGTHKVRVKAEHEELHACVHDLVLHNVHTDLLLFCLPTCSHTAHTPSAPTPDKPRGRPLPHTLQPAPLTQVVLAGNVVQDGVALRDLASPID